MRIVLKSRSLKLLETSWLVQACNGIALLTLLTAGVRSSLFLLVSRDCFIHFLNPKHIWWQRIIIPVYCKVSYTNIRNISMEFFEVIRNFDTCTQRFLAGPLMAFGGTLPGKQCPMLSHPGSQVTYKNIRRERVLRVVLEVVVVATKSQHHGAECIWSKHSVKSKNCHAATMLMCSLKPSPCHEKKGFAYLHFQSSPKFHFIIIIIIFIYLLQLGCYPVAVVILHVNKTWNCLLLNLSREGYMRSMKWQLGILGTISAFAFRHRETEKNLCRGGRSQDLPNTDF